VAGLVVCALLVAVVGVALLRDVPTATIPPVPSRAQQPGVTDREGAAADLLFDLTEALRGGSRQEAVALAAPGHEAAARRLGAVYDNVRKLGITALSLRYVDEEPGALSAEDEADLGDRGFVAQVEVRWRISRFDREVSTLEVPFTLQLTARAARFVSAGSVTDARSPLWLLEPLAVGLSRDALVMAVRPADVDRYLVLADRARRDVRDVLPQWRGRVVVEVPRSPATLASMLGAEEGTYDAIAAVTSTVDGSVDPGSPVHIYINPDVFATLGENGAQIVVSHEATHLATDAAVAATPMWLLEGFADYVALSGVELPVSVAASQILTEVRRDGPPRALPGPGEFDPAEKALGKTYEAAWLACRFLAEEYGEQQLIAFYRAAKDETSTQHAFRDVLGTTQAEFTAGWRRYLRRLA